MAATAIIMAILGCGDAGTSCEAVSVAPVRYESVSACVAAQDEVLAASDIMYPVVTAQCRPVGSATPASLPKPAKPSVKPSVDRPALKVAALRG